MTREELRAKLAAEAEQMINEVLGAVPEQDMTLTEIEDVALAARREMGERITQRLVEYQVERHSHELPLGASGKSLRPKGKKVDRSRRVPGTSATPAPTTTTNKRVAA